MIPTSFRAYNAAGEILAITDTTGGKAKFKTDGKVDRVVFYGGQGDDEFVLGTTTMSGESGALTVEFVPEED